MTSCLYVHTQNHPARMSTKRAQGGPGDLRVSRQFARLEEEALSIPSGPAPGMFL